MKSPIKFLLFVSVVATVFGSAAHAQDTSNADDRQAFIENFLQADSNSDAMLSRSEFEKLMKLNAADNLGRSPMIVRTGAYKMVFDRLDKNSDEVVSGDEFEEFLAERG